jgi:hypothetical protein
VGLGGFVSADSTFRLQVFTGISDRRGSVRDLEEGQECDDEVWFGFHGNESEKGEEKCKQKNKTKRIK